MADRSLVSVVDDDDSIRESLPDLLRQLGFAAQAFRSAEAFLASDAVDETGCLLLDVAMPGMSGPNLQRELTRRRHSIPIVYITGGADRSVRLRLLEGGAVDCLFKPLSEQALAAAISVALGRPRVFIVDDDFSVRESLELLIASAGWQPEAFASARAFLDRRRPNGPSCLILDLSLPDLNGLELQERITGRDDMPIIFISGYGDVPTTVKAMKAGAVEFLTKPFRDDALLDAVRNALERSRAARARDADLRDVRDRRASLTAREREIMDLVVAGLLNKQIAATLGISEVTVKAHRGQVMRKMKVDSLADLVRTAGALASPTDTFVQ